VKEERVVAEGYRRQARGNAVFKEAQNLLVGGVDSPVRAFKSVGGQPLIIREARGARIVDADGNAYVDYVCSWGAMILGHAHPRVTRGIAEQAALGASYGMTSELEVELARRVTRAFPSMERIRFVSSGTEATMSAVRVARAFTRRNLVLKFEGCYHGHADSFLSQAGSGLATLGIAASPGVPPAFAELTLNAPYNDIAAVERMFGAHRGEIAAVIVEPVAANMGVVPPGENFLRDLSEIARRDGALLIFDEVITGFRLSPGGAQSLCGIRPDLTTLGKIIGGGLPAAAYGGRAEIMEMVAPLGPVYQAGTLSGNPLAMRAGIETLEELGSPGFYEALDTKAARLAAGIREGVAEAGVAGTVNRAGSLLTLFFTAPRVADYAAAKRSDTARFARFFQAMLDRGFLLPPSQFEALFVSAAHTAEDIENTVRAVRESLAASA
jgi:glutamate-1-semialdehyde 2,1-aminomutase